MSSLRTFRVNTSFVSLALASVFALGPACDSGEAKPPNGEAKAPTGEAKAPTGEAKAGVERPEMKKHLVDFKPDELERLRLMGAEVAADLDAAQKAVDAKDWPAAITAYKKALALDEDNPHVHGALGWAQFNANDLDGADENLHLALRFENDAGRRADYLYRLGRVEEAQGNFVDAKRHYDHSLRLKDNPEAKAHDEAIAAKAAEACKNGKCEKPDYATLDEACTAMVDRVHRQMGLAPHAADQGIACSKDNAQRVALTGGDASEAVLLKVSGEHGIVEETEYDLLAHIEGGWHWVGTFLDVENPHKDGVMREGKVIGFEARELMPQSPGTEILLHVELEESDSNLDDNIVFHDEHEAYIVCGVNHGKHVCHEIPVRLLYEAEALDVNRPAKGETSKRAFKATAVFDGKGKVTVSGEGDIPADYKGTHEIDSLSEPEGFLFLHDD